MQRRRGGRDSSRNEERFKCRLRQERRSASAGRRHRCRPARHAPHRHPAREPRTPRLENILRVDAGRIDSVLNLVGELIIGKSMLQQALNEFRKRYPKELLRGKFADAMAFQARVLNDLQRSVMKIRMVPVEQLFRRFPRMVRDVARQCGREVELVLSGQDTDLDKGILDAIAEPLTHLVRNAVSHGIEPAEERRQAGQAAARNDPAECLSPGQPGGGGSQRRRARHRCAEDSRQGDRTGNGDARKKRRA